MSDLESKGLVKLTDVSTSQETRMEVVWVRHAARAWAELTEGESQKVEQPAQKANIGDYIHLASAMIESRGP
jgi:hypothetical protein